MRDRLPKQGECYRHFKGNFYQVMAVAKHSETMEEVVVYQCKPEGLSEDDLKDEPVFVRPLEMFLSRVDRNKYPDADQEFRFELQQSSEESVLISKFLELKDLKEKIQFLQQEKLNVTRGFLLAVSHSHDFVLGEGGLEEQYQSAIHYLKTVIKYEGGR